MRHQRAGLHLSRTSAHRQALFSNLVAALFTYERIKTTDAKAKETRRLAERTITWARRLGDVLTKDADERNETEKAQVVHAVRMARRVVRDRSAVVKLFDEIGPRYLGRHGGYTRIMKVGQRPGDAAPMSILELIPDGAAPRPADEGDAPEPEKSAQAGKAGKGASAKGEKTSAKSSKAKEPASKSAATAKARSKGESGGEKAKKAAAPAKAKSKAKKKDE
jgi:large subunit ribosomal protein L17